MYRFPLLSLLAHNVCDAIPPGGLLGLIFAGYVPLALSEPLPQHSLFCGQL